MKKNFLAYFYFILAFACFILLRVFAGKNLDGTKAETTLDPNKSVSEIVKDDSKESVSDIPVSPIKDEQEEIEDEGDSWEEVPIDEDVWHDDFAPVAEFENELPRIICWGDSLTTSIDEKSAYPDVLRELSGCEVINYGVESENAAMIAMREGGVRVNVDSTVIPADRQMIPVFLSTESGGRVSFLEYGEGGVNPCSICGIEGRLEKLNGAYYFTRNTKGERISVPDKTQFKTFGMNDAREGDVLVIFSGTNDMPSAKSVGNIIKLQRAMLEAANCDKYVIVGLTYAGGMPEIGEVNLALQKEYGDHFLDIRSYLLNYGIQDAGLNMTDGDMEDLYMGEIPRSLRADYVHGNRHFYRLLANQVYRKLQYLGYIPKE